MKNLTTTIIFLFVSSFLYGQSIKGIIYRGNSDTTVANAAVYYSGSMNGGTQSDDRGQFELTVKSSQIPIVVSCVGYYSSTVNYKPGEMLIVRLKPKTAILREVTIRADDMSRDAEMAIFKKEFLGTSKYARSCVITNMDDIDLNYNKKTKTLKASSDKPIIIENKRLGYTINYYLDKFEDDPKTVSMTGTYTFKDNVSAADKSFKEIQYNREDAYQGSRMQFVRALWRHSLDKSNFEIYDAKMREISQDDIVIQDQSQQRYIHLNGRINVVNLDDKLKANPLDQHEKYTFIDQYGYWGDGLVWWGIMGVQRIGDLLPFEYQSPSEKATDGAQGADPIVTALKKLDDYPAEKLHLQTDKPYYSVGEDLWFKAYLVDARQNQLSDLSRILRVDLLDDRDSVRQSLLLPLQNGLANGNLHLNDSTLSAGNYHLVAYTKWMQNFGSEYFFKKDITLVNALHGAVSGTLTDQFKLTNDGRQLNAQLSFTADNGMAYSNQPINYTISTGNKIIGSGKGVIGEDGKFSLSQAVKNEYKDQAITITTLVSKPGYRGQTQNFVIRPLASVADVQFFPEGGKLVNGIRTKVGFKALKPDGLGEDISGSVVDEGNQTVSEFKSDHAGMGVFALQPLADKTYTAVIKHQDGSEKRYALPKADKLGYVLNVNHVGDSLSVRVSVSPDLTNGREVELVAQNNGVAEFVAKVKLDEAINTNYIPVKKFRPGITQFTLFNPESRPVAERLVFVDRNDGLKATVKTDKTEYLRRDKVNLDLTINDADGYPVVGGFSVAVTDEAKVKINEDDETSILSNLLLTSDIKGHIEQPNYYFNPANANRAKHLDQLLLTQGWRRFTWEELQSNQQPRILHYDGTTFESHTDALLSKIKYPHEQSLNVSGNITTIAGKPIPKGKVTLFAKTGGFPIILDTVADEKGHYVFENLNFPDSAKILVKAVNPKNDATFNVKTTIDEQPRVNYTIAHDNYQTTNTALADYLRSTQAEFNELEKSGLMKNGITLKEVVIKEVKERDKFTMEKIIPHSSNPDPGSADYVIKQDILEYETHLLDVFTRIPGVYIKNGLLYSARSNTSFKGPMPMLVIADGAQIQSPNAAEYLEGINPKDIAGVEVLTGLGKTIYGTAGNWGVLIITTKRGDEFTPADNSFNKAHYNPQGYSATKEFYSPAYDVANPPKGADLRSTIYWNPNIITDANGHASFSYFNADGTGTYKVTLEGMDTKGGLVRKTFTYVVK